MAPTERGAIDNLRLTETEVLAPTEGYVQVRVEAVGLNFRDVLNVLDLYPGDPGPIGGDFCGVVTELGPDVTRIRSRTTGFRRDAGIDGQSGECAGSDAGAGAGGYRRDGGGEHYPLRC